MRAQQKYPRASPRPVRSSLAPRHRCLQGERPTRTPAPDQTNPTSKSWFVAPACRMGAGDWWWGSREDPNLGAALACDRVLSCTYPQHPGLASGSPAPIPRSSMPVRHLRRPSRNPRGPASNPIIDCTFRQSGRNVTVDFVCFFVTSPPEGLSRAPRWPSCGRHNQKCLCMPSWPHPPKAHTANLVLGKCLQ
jgi:hypothetical protein